LGISTIVVGYNKGWKQEVETGKKNNQKFVSIPYHRFRQKLSYKCELCGITCVFQEESYTSKASSIDMDEIPVYSEDDGVKYTFSGKRVKRGLYKSKDGLLLNADINGSVNILRKYLNECNAKALCADAVRALVNVPCQRINVLCTSPSL
jgi:IS605 OrfB family transposase